MSNILNVILEKDDKYWCIRFKDRKKGPCTQGKSIPDALRMLAEAYELWSEEEEVYGAVEQLKNFIKKLLGWKKC